MQDLTTGSLTGHLLRTTTMMLVGMIFQTLYLLVDLFWVSGLGADAVAAVGISGNLSFLVLAITQVLGVGATTMVSHASGRKDHDEALFLFNQSQALAMTAGALFLAAAMLGRAAYARSLSADGPTLAMALQYLLYFIPAMALQFPLAAMGAALRGSGNFRVGMIVQSGTVIINIVLAPILIFGWGTGYRMGVSGAALATLIAIAIGLAWMTTYFIDAGAYLRIRLSEWAPRFGVWGRMLKIGLPAGAEFALMGVYLVIVYAIARPFGAIAQAGFGIGFRIVQSAFLPVVALAFAVAPVAGQNFGARQHHRVRQAFKAAAGLAAIGMLATGALIYLLAARLIGIFSIDPAVIEVGVGYLRVVAISFVFSGVTFVTSSMFQAMGNTLPSLATSTVRILVSIVPVLILSSRPGFELKTIWYISVVSVVLQMLLNLTLLRREFRLRLT